jgi:hypothetical protein
MKVAAFCLVPLSAATLGPCPRAAATPVDFNFSFSYSGQSISGRLVGLEVDAGGNATEVDPTSVLIFHAPAIVGLPASPEHPYVLVPHTFERSTLFNGIFMSTTPGVYGFQVTNYSITPATQNLLMSEAGGDVTLVFNFGATIGPEGGVATYGIQAEEDALWPAINTAVTYTLVSPPPPCAADYNADGAVNSADFFAFLNAFFAGMADFNDDGATTSQDFFDFLAAFFAGC